MLLFFAQFGELEHAQDIFLHAQFAEYGSLLGEIADAVLGPLVHGEMGDLGLVEEDLPPIGLDQPHDHVEGGGLAGPVRPQQPDDLPLVHFQGNPPDHLAAPVRF